MCPPVGDLCIINTYSGHVYCAKLSRYSKMENSTAPSPRHHFYPKHRRVIYTCDNYCKTKNALTVTINTANTCKYE